MPSPNNVLLSPSDGDDYWHVVMGPIPGRPDWHEQAKESSYPFPTERAANAFAQTHRIMDQGRDVRVVAPTSGKA